MTQIRVPIRVYQQKWSLQQDWEHVIERAPREMFPAIFKKKNLIGEKASRSAYD